MLEPRNQCCPKYFLSFRCAKCQEEKEQAARRAHDTPGDGALHLDCRWPGSCLTSRAEFIGETHTSSPQESQAFACRAEQEQRHCCWLIESCLPPSTTRSGGLFHSGSQTLPLPAPGHSLLLSPQLLGMQKPRRDSFFSLFLPSGVETPQDLDTKRVRRQRATQLMQHFSSSPADAS